jgi:Holliday junction resolvase-like predicted endonuclease
VEVKTRRTDEFADPEANVTREKQKRICRAAHQYVEQRDDPTLYYRFDVVSVLLPEKGKPAITLYRDAFRDEFRR